MNTIQKFISGALLVTSQLAQGSGPVPLISGIQAKDVKNSINSAALLDGVAGNSQPQWESSNIWNSANYPMVALFDLGQAYEVYDIELFHGDGGSGNSQIQIESLPLGSNINDSNAFVLIEKHHDVVWNSFSAVALPAHLQTRYLRLTINSQDELYHISEIQVMGSPLGTAPAPAPAPTVTPTPIQTVVPGPSGRLTPAGVVNVQNSANAIALFDGIQGASQPQWSSKNVWDPSNFPMIARVDLGAVTDLTGIELYHGNGGSGHSKIQISYLPVGRNSQNSSDYVSLESHSDSVWDGFSKVAQSGAVQTQFLEFKIASMDEFYTVSEIRLTGSNGGLVTTPGPAPAPPSTPPATSSRITVDQFIGINAFIDDPLEKMKVAGFVREYHSWSWDEGNIWSGGGNRNYLGYPNNQMKFAPSEAAGGSWNFDTFYDSLKAAGLTVSPAIKGAPAWLQGGLNFPDENKPVDRAGMNTTDPNSYQAKAHHMFQFAARYGSTHVADNLLTLDPSQPRRSGLGSVTYLEDWNEQDKNWMGSGAEFSAQEYAAMASADYDGHAKTMNQGSGTFGIKNADPNMKLVMGGIFQLNLDYIKQMKTWFEANRRDRKFAADVINFHDYAWSSSAGPGGSDPALSPEEFNWKSKLKAITQYRDQNLPGVEVWVSEFGYDTHPSSALRVPPVTGFDAQEVQGQWLVRGFLAFAAAGVDRVQMYMLRDVNPNDPTAFSTSGLVTQKGEWAPKKSWYYVSTLKNALTGMSFIGEQTSSDPNVLIYKFKNSSTSKGAYVVWAKTKQNYTVGAYALQLQGNPRLASLVQLAPGSTVGNTTSLSVSSNSVTVPVSERPVFIQVDTIQ